MLPTKFRFIWPSGFRGEDFFDSFGQAVSEEKIFLEINQSETDLPRMLPTKFLFIWPSGYRGEDSLEINQSTNQKQELPVDAMFVNGSGRNEQFYRRPAIDASYQVSVHLAKRFQRRSFKKLANQKQELPMVAMFVIGSERNEHSL